MEILWALVIILMCTLFTWLFVGVLCGIGLVDKCLPLVTPYLM